MDELFRQTIESPYLSRWSLIDEQTPDMELVNDGNLIKLHAIASMIFKNNPVAQSLSIARVSSILGGKNKTNVLSSDSNQKKAQSILDDTFKGIDINQRFSWQQCKEIICTGAFERGDVLVNLPQDKDRGDISTYVELIDSSRIQTPLEYENDSLVKNGVVFHSNGRVKGYWVKTVEAMDEYSYVKKDAFTFYPTIIKDEVTGLNRWGTFLFMAPLNLRPGQHRQIPPLTTSFKDLRYADQLVEAVVIGAQVAACHTGFITTSNAAGALRSMKGPALEEVAKLKPGTIFYLRKGDSVDFSSPSNPPDNTDTLLKRLMIRTCASVRQSYEITFLDLSNVNYSSWKGANTEIGNETNRWIRDFLVLDNWVSSTVLLEGLSKKMFRGSIDKMKFSTKYPVVNVLDPEKGANAHNIDLNKNKTTSQHQICDENNLDWDDIMEERNTEAIHDLESQALILVRKKELEQEHDIIFPDPDGKTERPGEEGKPDKIDKDNRRKEDGNI